MVPHTILVNSRRFPPFPAKTGLMANNFYLPKPFIEC